jgi:hypothetical protein
MAVVATLAAQMLAEVGTGVEVGLKDFRTKEDLDKPGRLGWQREVRWKETEAGGRKITGVFYIPPPHPATGLRKKMNSRKKISDFLDSVGSNTLHLNNFNLNRVLLGLGEPMEISRKVFMLPQKTKSIYKEFFEELPREDQSLVADPEVMMPISSSNIILCCDQPVAGEVPAVPRGEAHRLRPVQQAHAAVPPPGGGVPEVWPRVPRRVRAGARAGLRRAHRLTQHARLLIQTYQK